MNRPPRPRPATCALPIWLVLGAVTANAVTFQIADPVEFNRIIDTNAVHVTNATINAWLEGPTWIPSGGGYLVFCDQGNNRLKKLVGPTTLSDFLVPPANTLFNGTMLDAQERLIAAEAGGAGLRISLVTNGVVTPLVTACNGLKFYSPNDVAVKSDGTIWFTDPGYNGGIGAPPQPGFSAGYYVYRFDPANGNATCTAVITNGLIRPNGLCFSPDEARLYVADSDNARHRIQVYSVSASNTLAGGGVFANLTNGVPDGIRCDVDGRVWSSSGEGVYIFAAGDGHLIGKIRFLRTANLCFGGAQYRTLFMTGQPIVTSLAVKVAGAPSLKKLEAGRNGSHVQLSWPAPSTGFALQESSAPASPPSWSNSSLAVQPINGQNVATTSSTNAGKFFRLRLN